MTLCEAKEYVERREVERQWHAKLQKAARRYGKPFKCASAAFRREVLVGGKFEVKEAGK